VGGLAVALCLFGLFGYSQLGVSTLPNLDFPTVQVTTVYPGADPATVETNLTRPIEDAIAGLPNIERNGLTSISSQGVSTVMVQFSTAANPDLVGVDVERVVNGARGKLPLDADPPIVAKIDLNAFGVATVIFSGQQPLTTMQEIAENVIQKRFNAIPGAGATSIRSGITREIHVAVDEAALKGRGLTINHVVNAVQTQQIEVPAGSIRQGGTDFSVYFDSLAQTPDQLGGLVVMQTQAGSVRLRDIAKIEETYKKRDAIVRVNGQEGLALVVTKLADANTVTVVDGVRYAIDELQPRLPPGTAMNIVIDSSLYTEKSFHTVQKALMEAVIATGLILLLFLHTSRSTFIVLVSIWFRRGARTTYRKVRARIAAINAFLQEHISGMSTVQLFNREEREATKFEELNRKHRDANVESIFYYAVFYPVIELIETIGVALIVWYGGGKVIQGTLSVGALVSF